VSNLTKTETSVVIWLNIVTIVARSVCLWPAHMREDVHATRQYIIALSAWRERCLNSQHLFR